MACSGTPACTDFAAAASTRIKHGHRLIHFTTVGCREGGVGIALGDGGVAAHWSPDSRRGGGHGGAQQLGLLLGLVDAGKVGGAEQGLPLQGTCIHIAC